jgi:hypothetical protein
MKTIASKLLNVQGSITGIRKSKTNPHFKSQYFDINQMLEQVLPVLQDNGLILTQPIKEGNVYSIITDVESGEFVDSYLPLPQEANPQKLGSAITYYRRYTLQSLLSLQAEDDDGNAASTTKREMKVLPTEGDVFERAKEAWNRGDADKVRSRFKVTPEIEKLLVA